MAKKITDKEESKENQDISSSNIIKEVIWQNNNLRMADSVTKTALQRISESMLTQGLVYDSAVAMNNLSKFAKEVSNPTQFKFYGGSSSDKEMELIDDIAKLKKDKNDLVRKLSEESDDKQKLIEEYKVTTQKLETKEKINHILSRICKPAQDLLLETNKFEENFRHGSICNAVVVSIDIRKSTELMLKAKSPVQFSTFITELTQLLSNIIISNYGIFDKFTGDGILAFFPDFYSGEQAIIRALKAADECHIIFEKHYKLSRSCFSVFIQDVGLGIGIDFGSVTLVNTNNELTVVGIPVVYACRFSGAKAGETLLNQSAMEQVELNCKSQSKIEETSLFIKNEGNALAYQVELNSSVYESLEIPSWINKKQDEEAIESLNNVK